MERLRFTIEQYGRWKDLGQYIDRMEGHLQSDFSISVENAKALLETIGKEICYAKAVDLGSSPSVNSVLKRAFVALDYANEGLVAKVSGALATIGQELGNLRNDISPTAHGKSLDELRERNNKVDLLTREFLIDSTLAVAVFLIRAFEERRELESMSVEEAAAPVSIGYDEAEDFNAYWDETFGDFEMGDYSYPASEVLFNVDYQAYEAEYKAFLTAEAEDESEGEG